MESPSHFNHINNATGINRSGLQDDIQVLQYNTYGPMNLYTLAPVICNRYHSTVVLRVLYYNSTLLAATLALVEQAQKGLKFRIPLAFKATLSTVHRQPSM
jgi:hypothetical protein